jgi:hypothetical protein
MRPADAPAPLVLTLLGAAPDPVVRVGLQVVHGRVDPCAEHDAADRVPHGLVDPLHDPVRLRALTIRFASQSSRMTCRIVSTGVT